MIYGYTDLSLSATGLLYPMRKPKSIQLFRHDPINFERAYAQMGKLALFLEGAVDIVTIYSMMAEEKPE